MSKLIVSLTTIPSRVPYLQATIDSLWSQETPPDAVELNVPVTYSRRDLGDIKSADLPTNCTVFRVEKDYGPATKILPTVRRYQGSDARLVYCDDDRIYDKGWLTRLTQAAREAPDDAIAERFVSSKRKENRLRWGGKGAFYVLLREVTFKRFEPLGKDGFIHDIAEGCGGVLIRPHFLKADAFEIPDILWTVDDVWLSGNYIKNGHRVLPSGASFEDTACDSYSDVTNIRDVDPLYLFEHEGVCRLEANVACIRYMRKHHGVFRGRRRLPGVLGPVPMQ